MAVRLPRMMRRGAGRAGADRFPRRRGDRPQARSAAIFNAADSPALRAMPRWSGPCYRLGPRSTRRWPICGSRIKALVAGRGDRRARAACRHLQGAGDQRHQPMSLDHLECTCEGNARANSAGADVTSEGGTMKKRLLISILSVALLIGAAVSFMASDDLREEDNWPRP